MTVPVSPSSANDPGALPPVPNGQQPNERTAAWPPAPRTGAMSWAWGFVLFVPIPFLNVLASGVMMAAVYKASARSPLAVRNARSAANWGLTFALATTLLLIMHFIIIAIPRDYSDSNFFPMGIPILLYAALVLAHAVILLVCTVRANNSKHARVPLAIHFIREK